MPRKPQVAYDTVEQAMDACRRLEIKDAEGYKRIRKRDPLLPPNMVERYGYLAFEQAGGWNAIRFYRTWEEAAAAVAKLGITKRDDYYERYKLDGFLPSAPERIYALAWKQNGEWPGFLGSSLFGHQYETYAEAQFATRLLGITSITEYKERHTEDPRLPAAPWFKYRAAWKRNGGWPGFFERPRQTHISRAARAALKLELEKRREFGLALVRRRKLREKLQQHQTEAKKAE